jgi:large subunit ribosomal protein L9
MNVILLKDVDKVGMRGDVVSVARGYARNFLFPRKLAEEATEARVTELRKREGQRAQHEAKTAEQAQSIAETLNKTVLSFEVKAGPTGSLFGSVTPTDIADEIWRTRKIRVDRRKIDVDNLKRIGRYDVPIDLFDGVRVEVKTLVVPEGGELPSDEELEAMAATEAAEQAAAAPAPAAEVEYEDVPETAERTQTPAEAAESADSPQPAPQAEDEPEWRADAEAALRDRI